MSQRPTTDTTTTSNIDATAPTVDAAHIEPNSDSTTTSDEELFDDNVDRTNANETTIPPPAQSDSQNILTLLSEFKRFVRKLLSLLLSSPSFPHPR
jgi:hypothetical protein